MSHQPVIDRAKAASAPLRAGEFYNGTVTAVNSSGLATIKIAALGTSYGQVLPLGTTPLNRVSVGDILQCTFTDESALRIVAFGPTTLKADIFASAVTVAALTAALAALDLRVTALEGP